MKYLLPLFVVLAVLTFANAAPISGRYKRQDSQAEHRANDEESSQRSLVDSSNDYNEGILEGLWTTVFGNLGRQKSHSPPVTSTSLGPGPAPGPGPYPGFSPPFSGPGGIL